MRAPLATALLLAPLLAGCIGGALDEPLVTGRLPEAGEPTPPAIHWATPEDAVIRPGTPLELEDRACPTSFVLVREDSGLVFVATTAHCVEGLPIGTLAIIGGGENIAVLVYSSWDTMAQVGESDPDALEYNDFAVFKLDSGLHGKTNPALPQTGGPTRLASEPGVGARVRAFAAAAPEPSWRDGFVTGHAGSWAALVHSPTPSTPGQMGGPVVTPEGEALGVVVNLGILPNPGANGVARLDTMMAYAEQHAKLPLAIAKWEHLNATLK